MYVGHVFQFGTAVPLKTQVKRWRQSNRKHGWVVTWVAGTSSLFTLKHRLASEKGFGSIMASENITLGLSVWEQLSYFATSSFNAPPSRGADEQKPFLFCPFFISSQNASSQFRINHWAAHRSDWGFSCATRGLSAESVWQAAAFATMHACKGSTHWSGLAPKHTKPPESSPPLSLSFDCVPGQSEKQWAAPKHNCTLLQLFL